MTAMPKVNLSDSQQNEFIQDWLTQFMKEYPTDSQDYEHIEAVIEAIQEIYSPKVPYEVQVKQHRIEQLEALLKVAHDSVRDLNNRIANAKDTLG